MTNPAGRRSDWALFRRLLAEARAYRLHLLGLLGNGLLSAPLTMLVPLPLKIAVDSVLGDRPLPRVLQLPGLPRSPEVALAVAVGLLIVTAALRQLQEMVGQVLRSYVLEKQTLELRARLFLHAQRLSLAHHDLRGTADAISRIEKDARESQAILLESVFPSISASFALVGMLVVTARIDWQLALAALTIAPLLFMVNRHYRRKMRVQ